MRNEYELLKLLNDSCNKQRALVRFKLKGGINVNFESHHLQPPARWRGYTICQFLLERKEKSHFSFPLSVGWLQNHSECHVAVTELAGHVFCCVGAECLQIRR